MVMKNILNFSSSLNTKIIERSVLNFTVWLYLSAVLHLLSSLSPPSLPSALKTLNHIKQWHPRDQDVSIPVKIVMEDFTSEGGGVSICPPGVCRRSPAGIRVPGTRTVSPLTPAIRPDTPRSANTVRYDQLPADHRPPWRTIISPC